MHTKFRQNTATGFEGKDLEHESTCIYAVGKKPLKWPHVWKWSDTARPRKRRRRTSATCKTNLPKKLPVQECCVDCNPAPNTPCISKHLFIVICKRVKPRTWPIHLADNNNDYCLARGHKPHDALTRSILKRCLAMYRAVSGHKQYLHDVLHRTLWRQQSQPAFHCL